MTTFYNTYANATNYGGFRWNAGGGEGADGGGTELMRLRGSRLGIMNPNPPKTLSVSGDISGSGTLEILGNITGSGNLEIAGNISGSSVSTGSFGKVEAGIFSGSFHGQIGARYLHDQSTASTTWTMIHNLGSKYPNVTVYDSNDEIIIPASITATTSNQTTLTFPSAVAGVAQMGLGGGTTVSGRTFIFEQGTASTLWAVTHSLGEQFPAVTVYDADDRVLLPAEIQSIDSNHMEITFQNATSGNGHFSVGNGLPGVNADNAGNFMRVSAGGTHIEYTTSTQDVTGSFDISGSITLTGEGTVSSSATSTGSFGHGFIASRLGVGVVNPDAKLKIEESTAGANVEFKMKAISDGGSGRTFIFTGDPDARTLAIGESGEFVINEGNVGIGVTPETHNSSFTSLQIGGNANISTLKAQGASGEVDFGHNYYYSAAGNDKYISTDEATQLRQGGGAFRFRTAPSGTADNAITFTERMTILQAGNVGIGTNVPDGKLHIFDSSVGAVTANSAGDELIIEAANPGISILGVDAGESSIIWGSVSDNVGAQAKWSYDANTFRFRTSRSGAKMVLGGGDGANTLELTDTEISGSTTSTGSFGLVKSMGTSGRVQVSSTGNVASQRASFNSQFNDSQTHTSMVAGGDAGQVGLYMQNTSTTADTFAGVGFRVNNYDAGIHGVYGGSTNVGKLSFQMEGEEKFVINTSNQISGSAISTGSFGRIQVPQTHYLEFLAGGVGTAAKWQIFNNASNVLELSSTAYGGSPITIDATGGGVNVTTNLDVGAGIDVTGAGNFTGNLEILKSAPTLILKQNDTSTNNIEMKNSGGSIVGRLQYDTAGGNHMYLENRNAGNLVFETSDIARLTINSSGDIFSNTANAKISGSATSTGSFGELHIKDRVGIGTTSPSASLHVEGSILVDVYEQGGDELTMIRKELVLHRLVILVSQVH